MYKRGQQTALESGEAQYRKCLAEGMFTSAYINYIKRPGAKELLEFLKRNGFFEEKASVKRHGAYAGGLAEHSVNVFMRLAPIGEKNYTAENMAVVALLHGVYKISKRCEPELIYYGEKSVREITRFMQLTEEETITIRYHVGAYEMATRRTCDTNRLFEKSKLALMFHVADVMATYMDDGTASENVTETDTPEQTGGDAGCQQ